MSDKPEFVPVQIDNELDDTGYWHQYRLRINKLIAEEAYKEYAAMGHGSQSFERLHERGGFGIGEILALLHGRIKRLEGDRTGKESYLNIKPYYRPPNDD